MRLPLLAALLVFCEAKLECDPTANVKKQDPGSPESYLYCNLEGAFSKRKCISGKVFNAESGECESLKQSDDPGVEEDPFSKPFYQAPDDLCGGGIPLTILSAPVACNPSISSCPDGYVCRVYERTGTSYCCQGGSSLPGTSQNMCSGDQVTYIDPKNGKPMSCVLSNPGSCPTGFGCNLVSGTATRCCGKDFGCPFNSAAFLKTGTASYQECTPGRRNVCQTGFSCIQSSTLDKNICCSNPSGSEQADSCPGGESPLSRPSSCSPSSPCPNGYACRDGKCCPSSGVCPAGLPQGGGPSQCSEKNPCGEGYQCVTNAGLNYCCPSRDKVCGLPKNAGIACASSRPSATRYYFDIATGSCRSFQFSQCGGNPNNFNSLEECEGFCVDSQCTFGQAYRVGAVNAVCAMTSVSTCPQQYSCQTALFGPSSICCPTPELTCNEMVSAGTPCYGRSVTIQRYYFNPATRKCQPFQYYGCNGNGNNFASMEECSDHCVTAVDAVCGGAAPLMDPNLQPQRCSDSVPCPAGYECNEQNYCCPLSSTACGGQFSRGNICSGSVQRSMWYYDSTQRKCKQFPYNGCGGTANRFMSQKSCNEMCVDSNSHGSCPRGMSPFIENGDVLPKSCTLNVMGTCPPSSSCVRSTSNIPICCQTVTVCPDKRTPYVIPGSNSVVACNLDADECPAGNVCLESSSVAGFFMCCSATQSSQRPPQRGRRPEPDTLAALMRTISPCPPQLHSNGQTCTVNAIGECPSGHICFRDVGFERGTCCRAPSPPKCAQKTYIPVFLEKTQVQICQADLGGCPRDSRCMTSTVAKMAICCKKYSPPRPSDINQPTCKNGNSPFFVGSQAQECNFMFNTCPDGYKCEFSSTGKPVCCADNTDIRCPHGSSVFEYGGRPLACPAGSMKCPVGYSCLPSTSPDYHLCCSTGSIPTQPQCARGEAYVEPGSSERRFCSPIANNCPTGYQCLESDRPGQFICCTQGDLTDRFKGFCPPRQIPYVSREGYPPTCHMQLNPCPTTAPYVCIYSPQKQDSFCCAPIDTAVRPMMVPDNVAARPGKDFEANQPEIGGLPTQSMTVPGGNPMAGMTATFPGGPVAPGLGGAVAIPDPNPGVSQENILPPTFVNSGNTANVGNNGMSIGNSFGGTFGQQNNNFGQNNFGQSFNQNGFGQNNFGQNMGLNQNKGQSFQNTFGTGVISQVTSQLSEMATGCPLGSRPLVRTDKSVVQCTDNPCPEGFACVFAERENRFQCCSSSSIMLASSKSESTPSPTSVDSTSQLLNNVECPPGFFLIDGKCLKVLFAGQKGCISDDQCSAREANSTCDSGYCICPAGKPLVHGGKCVGNCPEGFSNIAGRCYDPTTVIFMDSVDERANGTIGGYCKETLVEEKRCDVENSYCSEKTITCTCKAGYELQMDFDNKDDKGSCKRLESSKFAHAPQAAPPAIDEELYFIDISPKILEATNSTADDDVDVSKYLFQTDELIPVFA